MFIFRQLSVSNGSRICRFSFGCFRIKVLEHRLFFYIVAGLKFPSGIFKSKLVFAIANWKPVIVDSARSPNFTSRRKYAYY